MIDVSIIIVNYNTKGLLKNCIDSLIKHSKELAFEIIVIDNNSTDDDYSFLNLYKKVKPILGRENLGFGRANNLASKKAEGKYLLFLNPDTIVYNNAVKDFFDYFENNKEGLGVIGCYLTDENRETIHSYAEFKKIAKTMIGKYRKSLKRVFFLDNFSTKRSKKKENKQLKKEIKEVDYITGADLFMTKNIFDEIGGFDEDFFMYYEEAEMQYRISKLGLKRVVINTPQIAHLEGQSFNDKPSNVRRKMYGVSEVLYVRKIAGKFGGLFYKSLYLINIIIDTVIDLYRFRYSLKDNINYFLAIFNEKAI